jgi:glutathione S-transferase
MRSSRTRPSFRAIRRSGGAVEEAERRGEEFQNATRRVFYCAARRDRKAFACLTKGTHSAPGRLWLSLAAPLLVKAATKAGAASDEAGRADLAALPAMLDQVDAWIEEGLLDGEELNAADFQIAPNIRALSFCKDLAPFLHGRPAERLAWRVAPDYPGHVKPVLTLDWLEPLRSASSARTLAGS